MSHEAVATVIAKEGRGSLFPEIGKLDGQHV
jgi:hypothetical protein